MNVRAALAVTVAILGVSGAGCALLPLSELDIPSDRDHFFHVVAVNFNAPELCGRISPRADGGGGRGWSSVGSQVTTLQSSCYQSLASSGRIVIANPHEMEAFAALMQTLGYGDRDVVESEYNENPQNSPTYAAYARLRDDPTFLQRLVDGPSYREPRSDRDARPAYPVEFLYQMVAVERGDAALCENVSPNATFVDFGQREALLQSRCYRSLASNTRQIALCDPLPRAGSSRFINEVYDSLERCRESIAIEQRTPTDGLHSGPEPFPHAEAFPAALRAIGYAEDFASTVVPEPPVEAYWDFVSRLKFRATDADRAEFVRRAMTLR